MHGARWRIKWNFRAGAIVALEESLRVLQCKEMEQSHKRSCSSNSNKWRGSEKDLATPTWSSLSQPSYDIYIHTYDIYNRTTRTCHGNLVSRASSYSAPWIFWKIWICVKQLNHRECAIFLGIQGTSASAPPN